MKRLEFSNKTKNAAYERCGGVCEGCGERFRPDDRLEFDHVVPDALRKNNALENCQVLCSSCHLEKTRGDITRISKAKRVEKKHNGTFRPPRRIVPGSRASKWKKPLHGNAVLRNPAPAGKD
jgi:hypothetical protein